MIRANELQDKLLHLIGWQQHHDTSHIKIADSLTKSESGLYFQQAHPLITLANLHSIAPDFDNIKFEAFSLTKQYKAGEVVHFNGKLYRSKRAVYGCTPDGEFSPVNLLEGYNFSFEDENPFNNWKNLRTNNITEDDNYKVAHPGYDSDTAISIISRPSDTIARSIYMQTIPNITFKPGHKYKIQLAAKNNRDSVANFTFRVNSPGGVYLINSGRLVNSADWQIYEGLFETQVDRSLSEIACIIYQGYDQSITIDAFSLKDITNEDAPIHIEDYWEELDLFSDWLEQKTKASIQKAIFRVINEKLVKTASKNIIENKTLFDGTNRITDLIKNKKNLVGFEIVPVRAQGVTTKINRIGLQFTEPGNYTLYIMHSSMNDPVYTLHLTRTKKNSAEWFTVDDIYLPYESELNSAGGSWYICYFQSDLPEGSQAIRKERDWSKGPCQSCSRREFELWKAWSRYIEVHPFYINEEQVDAVKFNDNFDSDFNKRALSLWDIENNQYTYDTNYGINLDITVSCDITNFLIEQRLMLQDVILKQVACDILREYVYNANVRTNRNSINASRSDILQELDGDTSAIQKSGLSYQLDQAYKALDISTRGIDRICLPCVNNGIKYRSI